MAKSETLSWRISPVAKQALEDEARERQATISQVLDQIVGEWARNARDSDLEEGQRRLHARASSCFGQIRGSDPRRSEKTRETIRKELKRRRANKSTH